MADQSSTNSASPAHAAAKTHSDKVHKAAVSSAPQPNPRSCVTCRKRKVKCDKNKPCQNCQRAHIECIFPAPGRAPRKPRKLPDGELMARMRRLEAVVQALGTNPEVAQKFGASLPEHLQNGAAAAGVGGAAAVGGGGSPDAPERKSSLSNDFGKLVVSEGRSRYVTNLFWSTLTNEVEDLRDILEESSDDDMDHPSPSTDSYGIHSPPHWDFILPTLARDSNMQAFHPQPAYVLEYWRVYREHVDPLVKMVHIPTLDKQVRDFASNPTIKIPKGLECFLFAVYFAAVVSLTPDDTQVLFHESRDTLLPRFRRAFEHALARAHFLVTDELIVVQAFAMYLVVLRRFEDARVLWSLCGLLGRMAISLGLHRDGTNFGLSPFDVEMRRRTWWNIVVLDVRTSDNHGSDPVIISQTADTRFPLNVWDEDLSPTMTEFPPERVGITENTFCLIRFSMSSTLAQVFLPPPTVGAIRDRTELTLAEKERIIRKGHEELEERFLRHCERNNPMHWIISTLAKLIMAKQWLGLYQPYQRPDADGKIGITQETKDRLFVTALESIEYALLLDAERKTVKWGWLFKTYNQWHAISLLLSELSHRTTGPLVDRSWRAINATLGDVLEEKDVGSSDGNLRKPFRKLLAKARAAREEAIKMHSDGQSPTSAQTLTNQRLNLNLNGKSLSPNPEPSLAAAMGIPIDSGRAKNKYDTGENTIWATRMPKYTEAPPTTANSVISGGFQQQNNVSEDTEMSTVQGWLENDTTQGMGSYASVTGGNDLTDPDLQQNIRGAQTLAPTPGITPGFEMGIGQYLPSDMPLFVPEQGGFMANPMSMGGDDVPLTDWDEMLREFEMQQGGPQQMYGRRPVLDGTWM